MKQELGNVIIYNDDLLNVLPSLPDECFDVIWLDPPFNVGKDYCGASDRRADYWQWSRTWFSEIIRVLKPTGSVYSMNLSSNIGGVLNLYSEHGLMLQNIIVWTSPESQNTKRRFVRRYQPIVFGTKGKDYYFNTYFETRLRYQRWSGKEGQRGQLSDIWDDIPRVYSGSIVHKEAILVPGTRRKLHPCQAPIGLTRRIFGFSCPPNGYALDPFAGVGGSLVAAKSLGLHITGIEQNKTYVDIILERLQ